MLYSSIIFDLDETIYRPGIGIWNKISDRIHLFMEEEAHIPKEMVVETRLRYYNTYGTTMRGLVKHHQINPQVYLDFVHDFAIDNEISFDAQLKEMIANLPYERFIFTNATRKHAQRILEILDIAPYFSAIVDIMDVFPACKPMPESFEIALSHFEKAPEECIFVDDSQKNLDTAKKMGLFTILPNADKTKHAHPHAFLKELVDLPDLLPPII